MSNLNPTIGRVDDRYVVKFPRGYRTGNDQVRKAFGDKTVYDEDEQGWLLPATVEYTTQIDWLWPNACWQTHRVTFAKKRKRVRPPERKYDPSMSEKVEGGLYRFQKEGVDFLAPRESAILGDEMGLGKTVQAISTSRRIDPKGLHLVVCPNTLVENWRDEILKWYGDTDVFILRGTKAQRVKAIEELKKLGHGWGIISWDALRLHATPPAAKNSKMATDMLLAKMHFDTIIADEAHRAKNRKALQTEALKRLHGDHRYALTGTPVMNRPDELWSILNWLEPSVFTSYWRFFDNYIEYIDGYFGKEIIGPKNLDHLGKVLSKRMIRRTKDEVLDMPPKTYKTIYVDMSPAQKKAYDEMAEYLITQLEDGEIVTAAAIIAQVMRLKQICVSVGLLSGEAEGSAKIDTLMDILEDAGDSKTVVFSQFARAVGLMHRRLVKAKMPHVILTGKHSILVGADGSKKRVTRGEVVKAFQNDPKYKVYIGTTQAGGVGITLTAAKTVVFLDKMWTPADQLQAEDRLHRIGQKNNVLVISLLTRGTIEDAIENKLSEKDKTITEIMDLAKRVVDAKRHGGGVEIEVMVTERGRRVDVEVELRKLTPLLRRRK